MHGELEASIGSCYMLETIRSAVLEANLLAMCGL